MTYTRGEGRLAKKQPHLVVGTDYGYSPIAPGRLSLSFIEDEDFEDAGVLVEGIDTDGNYVNETILASEPFSKNDYIAFNRAELVADKATELHVAITDTSNNIVGVIKPYEWETTFAQRTFASEEAILRWGCGCNGDEEIPATKFTLVKYQGNKRFVLDHLLCTYQAPEQAKEFTTVKVFAGEALCVEVEADGSNATARAWFETQPIITEE